MELDFKDWLISEMAFFRLSSTIDMPGMGMPHKGTIEVDSMDMRFEDYDSGVTQAFYNLKFKAKLPIAPPRWLVFHDSTAAVVSEKVADSLDFTTLRDEWWEYAEAYNDDLIVKFPKKLRPYDSYNKLGS